MRVRVESGFIYQGRALRDGDEIDLPDPLAALKIKGIVVAPEHPAGAPDPQNRDPNAQTRDPRPSRTR